LIIFANLGVAPGKAVNGAIYFPAGGVDVRIFGFTYVKSVIAEVL
jgi:poly-gamma-glutamate capsule biosynthesis protein CapA/YwtB (metallophosphatase superfamily)